MGLLQKISHAVSRARYRPRIALEPTVRPIVRLGAAAYGGWAFVDTGNLQGSTIISCGLGEDASFDVAFARTYGARVIIVDPTPRAIEHFAAIIARLGRPATKQLTADGRQPAEAYDLEGLTEKHLELVPKALWTERGTLRFFAPPNADDVSHSIVNFRNQYRQDTDHIEVEATTLGELLEQYGLRRLPLLKLDIEGAENAVIPDMLAKGLYPDQVLVDYDEMAAPSAASKKRIEETHRALLRASYRAVWRAHDNYAYARMP